MSEPYKGEKFSAGEVLTPTKKAAVIQETNTLAIVPNT